MRVFINWSGKRSRILAEILRNWIPAVIQAAKPYFTPDDIAKGARWHTEVSKELMDSSIGLLCLTAENLEAPWLMFEAGALSRNLERGKVCPILFGVEPTDVKEPLAQFQFARFQREDIKRVMNMINEELGEAALSREVFDSVFDMWWPRLNEKVNNILSRIESNDYEVTRLDRDILEEVLSLTRSMSRNIQEQTLPFINNLELNRQSRTYWPPLLRKALNLLFKIGGEISEFKVMQPDFQSSFRQLTRNLEIEHSRELQISVIDKTKTIIYHDWEPMIGRKARYSGHDGVDIYDDIFKYPCGAVAWIDHTSNTGAMRPRERFNIALFRTIGNSEWRIVVEAHEEIF